MLRDGCAEPLHLLARVSKGAASEKASWRRMVNDCQTVMLRYKPFFKSPALALLVAAV